MCRKAIEEIMVKQKKHSKQVLWGSTWCMYVRMAWLYVYLHLSCAQFLIITMREI